MCANKAQELIPNLSGLSDDSLSGGPWNHPHGTGYNALFWHDCRMRAEQFLRMCPDKISNKLTAEFMGAAEVYGKLTEVLAKVKSITHSIGSDLPSLEIVEELSKNIREARDIESKGLDLLANIRKVL